MEVAAPGALKKPRLNAQDLQTHGYTDGCLHGGHVQRYGRGRAGGVHSDLCRDRFLKAIGDTILGRRRLDDYGGRVNMATAEQIERSDAQPVGRAEAPPGLSGTGNDEVRGTLQTESMTPGAEPAASSYNRPGPSRDPGGRRCREAPRGSEHRHSQAAWLTAPSSDMHIGLVGAFDDADYMHLISSMGACPGPYRRERRAASRRVVSEMYSPPKVTRAISSMPGCDLIPGFALDLTCLDPDDGMPFDFDVSAKREKALHKVRTERPAMIIGSVMCTAWCSWQALNNTKRDPEVVRREVIRARMHLDFMVSIYVEQIESGRLFLHEHTAGATSWHEASIERLSKFPGVSRVDADQCHYGA